MKTSEYATILDVLNRVPTYQYGKPVSSMNKIKETLHQMGCDETYVKNINESFCEGFGIAKEILASLFCEEYRKNGEK